MKIYTTVFKTVLGMGSLLCSLNIGAETFPSVNIKGETLISLFSICENELTPKHFDEFYARLWGQKGFQQYSTEYENIKNNFQDRAFMQGLKKRIRTLIQTGETLRRETVNLGLGSRELETLIASSWTGVSEISVVTLHLTNTDPYIQRTDFSLADFRQRLLSLKTRYSTFVEEVAPLYKATEQASLEIQLGNIVGGVDDSIGTKKTVAKKTRLSIDQMRAIFRPLEQDIWLLRGGLALGEIHLHQIEYVIASSKFQIAAPAGQLNTSSAVINLDATHLQLGEQFVRK